MKTFRVIFSLMLLSTLAVAGSSDNNQVDARVAFARLKALAGEWQADSPKGKASVRYELIAGGSVLLEHDSMPGHDEMLTAYHLDGDKLVLTHYCMAGNQPHMVAERFDGPSGQLDFAFAGGSNIAPGAGHMHNVRFHLISPDRFDADCLLRPARANSLKTCITAEYSNPGGGPASLCPAVHQNL